MSESNTNAFTASYRSPSNEHFNVSKDLPASRPSAVVDDKTQYLDALREAVTQAQEDINRELTTRMEEDKAREAATGHGTVDEDKEEENYGEEVQEEED